MLHVLDRDRWCRFRPIYLLALAQLLGGPLLLLQVTLFCKLTVEQAPHHGFARAVANAWESNEFQQTFTGSPRGGDPLSHERKRDATDGKVKPPMLPWSGARFIAFANPCAPERVHRERFWTPAWPLAPPGPPPRVG